MHLITATLERLCCPRDVWLAGVSLARIAPADPHYLVAARAMLPILVRRDSGDRFAVTEYKPLLR